jgi:hypothetical protein
MRSRATVLSGRLFVLLLALLAAFLLSSPRVVAEEPAVLVEYVVAPGDTLWEIAARVAPAGEDVRDTVARVLEVNGLGGASIAPGQRLLLPAG